MFSLHPYDKLEWVEEKQMYYGSVGGYSTYIYLDGREMTPIAQRAFAAACDMPDSDMLKKIEKRIMPICVFIIVFSLIILFEVLSIKFSSIIFILIGGLIGILYYSILNKKEGEVKWYILNYFMNFLL